MGAFYRCCDTPPYGVDATSGATTPPNPYPTMGGSVTTTLQYCGGLDSAGNSIIHSWPVDATKLQNILDLNVQWVRQTEGPYFIDQQDLNGAGVYTWGQTDSILCTLYVHGIEAEVQLEVGSVGVNDSASFRGNLQQHNYYDTPAQFGAFCTVMATHVHSIFPNDHLYSIPQNEVNTTPVVGVNNLGGTPPVPVATPTSTAGTLTIGTATNWEVTGVIGGVETLPSPPYYQDTTPASGSQSALLTWGPQAGATAYNVYRRVSGTYEKVASLGNVLTYVDSGGAASGTPPPTSTVTTAAWEGNIAAYTSNCYSAIKAVDPASVIYGFELTENGGASPSTAQFVTDERTNFSCGPGTCYDGISVHYSFAYPMPGPTAPCYPNSGGTYGIQCLNDVETATGSTTTPMMLGEFLVTFPGMVPDEPTKDLVLNENYQTLLAYSPNLKYINYANLDECALYPSGFFENGCVIDTTNKHLPSWLVLRPFYGLQASVPLGTAGVPNNIPTPAPTPT